MIEIRNSCTDDVPSIRDIYCRYIGNEFMCTLEEDPPTIEEMSRRREKVLARSLPYVVAVRAGVIVGFAYSDALNERSGYRFTATDSVYVLPDERGKGAGALLLRSLIDLLKTTNIKQVIAITFSKDLNPATHRLHDRFGFIPVGLLMKVGFKNDRWVDIAYLQLSLDSYTARPFFLVNQSKLH